MRGCEDLQGCDGDVGGLVDNIERRIVDPLELDEFNVGVDRVDVGRYIFCRKIVDASQVDRFTPNLGEVYELMSARTKRASRPTLDGCIISAGG